MSKESSLLWHSNAPWSPTGYGQQTAAFCKPLKDHYNLGISAFYGLESNVLPWNGIPVYPGFANKHGNETILEHANVHFNGDVRAGIVATLMDVWVLDPAIWERLDTCCWVPVDHDPAPDAVVGFFQASGAVPIAMSKFGRRMLEDAGLDPLYVPHAVDTSIYKPLDKTECREATGIDSDAFVVGMVAANKGNPSRKCFHEAFQAFKALHDKHPEARLYVHAEVQGRFAGVNLAGLMRDIGLDPDVVMFPDQYRVVHYPYQPETMARIFNCFDVLLSPSAGEGFGIPVLEAQACGVPVIVSDFSAQPELCGSGWLVTGRKVYTPMRSWQFLPDVDDIVDALRQAYDMPEAAHKRMGKKAREFALPYDITKVMDQHMLPALAEVERRFAARKPQTLTAAA
jgi:glycosyltransferase involved in cell wall biosynthesis